MTDEELREIKERHKPFDSFGKQACADCTIGSGDEYVTEWPCDAALLLDEIEHLCHVAEACCSSCEDIRGHRKTEGYLEQEQRC